MEELRCVYYIKVYYSSVITIVIIIIKYYYVAIGLETLFSKQNFGSAAKSIPKSSGMNIHSTNVPCNHGYESGSP